MTVVITSKGQFGNITGLNFVDIDVSIAVTALDDLLYASSIRIVLDSFANGRFLAVGKQCWLRGYCGHIRAAGSLVPDQFPMVLKLRID